MKRGFSFSYTFPFYWSEIIWLIIDDRAQPTFTHTHTHTPHHHPASECGIGRICFSLTTRGGFRILSKVWRPNQILGPHLILACSYVGQEISLQLIKAFKITKRGYGRVAEIFFFWWGVELGLGARMIVTGGRKSQRPGPVSAPANQPNHQPSSHV